MPSSLDLTPEQFRQAAGALGDVMAEFLESLATRRVCASPSPHDLIATFDEPLPRAGIGIAALIERIRNEVVPPSMTIGSPRYFGQFNPSPIPIAALSEFVVACLNQNAGSFLQSPVMTAIEHRVVRWLLDRVGYPEAAYGSFTSGGSTANLTALKMARDAFAPEVRDRGASALPPGLRIYASDQVHFSLARGLDILGLGRDSLARVDSDANYRMSAKALERAIESDLSAKRIPLAIVATAGTTPTGSLDPLPEIAEIAERHRIHLHVDAAYGGAALLSDRLRPRLTGIERADTITVDPHKWMMMPNEAGCLFVRDKAKLLGSFNEQPHYLADSADRHSVLPDYYRHGMQGSRRARAFKLWVALQAIGLDAIGAALDTHVELVRYLESRVHALPDFEICHAPDFALLCFRYAPPGSSPEQADEWNRHIQRAVEASGEAWFATTVLRGRKVLRINIESFRTTRADIDRLLAAILAAVANLPRE